MAVNTWIPDFASIGPSIDNHAKAWQDAMDWARLEVESENLKSAFVEWMGRSNPDNAAAVSKLPAWHYMTLGRVALLINKGAEPTAETAGWFDVKVSELLSKVPEPEVEVEDEYEERQLDSRQKKVVEYVNLYSFIDAVRCKHADDETKIERLVSDRLRRINPNRQQLKKLYVHFRETMSDAIGERDNPEVVSTIEPLILIVNVLAGFSGNATVARLHKNVDAKSQKAAAGVTVKNIDVTTNTVSINPAMIPGATTVLLYNTKNRKAIMYLAADGSKLGIKGTKITGYDETLSFAKTLRKPKTVLQSMRDAINSRRIRLIMDKYVNGKAHAVNGRISKDMVIVKVFK